MGSWIFKWAWLFVLFTVLGCTSSSGPGTAPTYGSGAFGTRCQKTEDCASGLCVRVDDAGGICTQSCAADSACPVADNWACLTGAMGLSVCACRKLADVELCANGI